MSLYRPATSIIGIAILSLFLTSGSASAQIVTDVTGEIDLMLEPFFETGWLWDDEVGDYVFSPLENQHARYAVGTTELHVEFDGGGYYSTGGLNQIDYIYSNPTPAISTWDLHAYTEIPDDDVGSGGYAYLEVDFTTSAPFRYRFEANADRYGYYYEVSFNNNYAYAHAFRGIWEGTFPLLHEHGNPLPTKFGTHVDQGILPAGTYTFWISTSAIKYRTYGYISEGTASLTIQLLGDANLDGFVGMADLGAVLDGWNQSTESLIGDFDQDNFIGIKDLNEVLMNWNTDLRQPAEPALVPEPNYFMGVGLTLILWLGTCRPLPQSHRRVSYRDALA
ncbi:MAG: hypothetical protein Kow00105_11820 [Phycisphaeraceae bacterium]